MANKALPHDLHFLPYLTLLVMKTLTCNYIHCKLKSSQFCWIRLGLSVFPFPLDKHWIVFLIYRWAENTFYTPLKSEHRQICPFTSICSACPFIFLAFFSPLCKPTKKKKLGERQAHEKSKTKNKLQLVYVRRFSRGLSTVSMDTIFPSIPEITRVAAPHDPHGQTGDGEPGEV